MLFYLLLMPNNNNIQMSSGMFYCQYCGRSGFKSGRSLTQHQNQNVACQALVRASITSGKRKSATSLLATSSIIRSKSKKKKHPVEGISTIERQSLLTDGQLPIDRLDLHVDQNCREYDDDQYGDFGVLGDDDSSNAPDSDDDGIVKRSPIDEIRANFKQYCWKARKDFLPKFTKDQADAINLLVVLRKSKASLDTYEGVMKWHFGASGQLDTHQSLSDTTHYLSRKMVFDFLRERYNMDKTKYNIPRELTLPSTKAKAKIIINDAATCMQSLLSDPSISDDDYLFYNDDPFAVPPDNIEHLSDINTGQAHRKTARRLVEKPGKQIALPIIAYIDGASTGQFVDLKITAFKFTLGIFNRRARSRPNLWRTLGYVPEIRAKKSRGKRILRESRHVDGISLLSNDPNEGNQAGSKVEKAQDFHTILAIILESFVPLQERGFNWDLHYKGKTYEVEFIPYFAFIICDTDEADRLCGAYTSRSGNVKQLCRYCQCPTKDSDNPKADYAPKTMPLLQVLVANKKLQDLKNLSQQYIKNALYIVQWGEHNNTGPHGATPLEMLHALLLGIFLYLRDTFFDQTGPTSSLSDDLNALATQYGVHYSRQSNRNMPKMKFNSGIRKGKLMAKEYTGILLLLCTVLRSTFGQELLTDPKNGHNTTRFANNTDHVRDWIWLIETLLQWEEWLKSDVMALKDVKSAQHKHRYIMYMIRKVANRTTGMGLKLTKYHAIVHMADDIINFGVPMNYDSGAPESGHKGAKTAAKLTQKKEDTFDEQTSQRLLEMQLLNHAQEEINGRQLWNYGQNIPKHSATTNLNEQDDALKGTQFRLKYDDDMDKYLLTVTSDIKRFDNVQVEDEFIKFLVRLQNKVNPWVPDMVLRSTHRRKGIIFRATPMHMGAPWRDWVLVNWGDDGKLPAKIWGFVDLSALPEENDVKIGGYDGVLPAIYAIVESSTYVTDPDEVSLSTMLTPILKEVGQVQARGVTKLRFYLADVEAFEDPITVIPDIGGKPNAYFQLEDRHNWPRNFVSWLRKPPEDIPDFGATESEESSDTTESVPSELESDSETEE